MAKKITWFESFTTTCKYSAILTDDEAKLYEENPEKFFQEVSFKDNQELEWDKISNEVSEDYEIEDED